MDEEVKRALMESLLGGTTNCSSAQERLSDPGEGVQGWQGSCAGAGGGAVQGQAGGLCKAGGGAVWKQAWGLRGNKLGGCVEAGCV